MKNRILMIMAAAACGAVVACSPETFSMDIDMRGPSASGLDLTGKSLAVVYVEDPAIKDSTFTSAVANGFAASLERTYFGGGHGVGMFKIGRTPGADYSSKDTLVNLVMDTGYDVVFLFDSPKFGNISTEDVSATYISDPDSSVTLTASAPFGLTLYAYDSMAHKDDTVHVFKGNSSIKEKLWTPYEPSNDLLLNKILALSKDGGERAGDLSAKAFEPHWKTQEFYFIYYESPAVWDEAAQLAYEYKWSEAITKWMTILKTNNVDKRSCAEFNIAQACYIMGQYELAGKWLDMSDRDKPISLSKTLRQRLSEVRK